MPFGNEGVRAGMTPDTTPTGSSERGASGASTPSTHRTHVWGPLWGTDPVETAPSFWSVQPSGQQIISPPTRSTKVTSVTHQTNRTTRSV